MTNRFHNKFHKTAHHTDPTAGDIDSAYDPIASPESPFKGDFHISGDMVVFGDITSESVTSSTVDATTLTVESVSGDILNISANTLELSVTDITGLPLSKITDVDTTGVLDKHTLIYDSGTQKWVSSPITVPDNSIGTAAIVDSMWGDGILKNGTAVDLDFANSGDIAIGTSEVLVVTPKSLQAIVDAIGAVKSDTKFVIVSHGLGIDHNIGVLPITYTLSGFGGTGVDPTQIREIWVVCKSIFNHNGHDVRVLTSMPNDPTDATVILCQSYGQNSDDDCGNGGLFKIPINEGQESFKLGHSGGGSGSFKIVGATQRTA